MIAFQHAMRRIGLSSYPEQDHMVTRLAADRAAGRVSLVEAPPATGKTHAIAWHALSTAADTGDRVIVAVPTIAVMRQVLATTASLAQAFPGITASAVYGRQEFVDRERARRWIAAFHPDALPAYDGWSSVQDVKGWTRASLDEHLQDAGYDLDLPVETSLLSSRGGPAMDAYRGQFETSARVVVATHAFLARDIASRIGRHDPDASGIEGIVAANERRLAAETADDAILPEWRHLLVDEAHLLAGGFMMALTTRVSFRRLLRILDAMAAAGIEIPDKRLENLRKAVDIMERAAPVGLRRTVRLSADLKHHRALVRGVETTVPEDLSGLEWDQADLVYLRRFRESAILAQRHRRATSPGLAWSDVQGRLSLTVSPIHLFRHLDYLWQSSRSAALFSATLYADDDEDGRAAQIGRQLGLPTDRAAAHEPFDSRWRRLPVVLHLPEGARAAALMPAAPSRAKSLAGTIVEAARHSETGMLALFTSHESISEAEELLKEAIGERILTTDVRGVRAAADRFVAAARDGRRPVWLATGPAWTGLDLPSDALDSLLVARLPYGIVNPILHEHMLATVKSAAGFRDYETDMLRMLSQGIGRLVRSRDLDGARRLWIADGRIAGHRAGARALAMLSAYPRQERYG